MHIICVWVYAYVYLSFPLYVLLSLSFTVCELVFHDKMNFSSVWFSWHEHVLQIKIIWYFCFILCFYYNLLTCENWILSNNQHLIYMYNYFLNLNSQSCMQPRNIFVISFPPFMFFIQLQIVNKIVAGLAGLAAWGYDHSFCFWHCWSYSTPEFERRTFTIQMTNSKGFYFRNIFGYCVKYKM